jgi:peptidoglycan/xylan/chitin deacetylase (PgdA/CDA1 family)
MRFFKTPRFFRLIFPNKTWGFSRHENSVYLTFDDGPDEKVTPWVLDVLKEKGVLATFFCVGNNVKRNPEIYQRIIDEGHAVGNHSMRHERGTKTMNHAYLQSIEEASQLIDSNLFRPPYGRMTIYQTRALKKKYKIIMWSWLSYDFDKKIPSEIVMKNAEKQIKAGDILVLHDNPKSSDRLKFLLPLLIDCINEKGLAYKKIIVQ